MNKDHWIGGFRPSPPPATGGVRSPSFRKEGLGEVLSLFLALALPTASNAQTPKKPTPPPAPTKYTIVDLGTLAGTDKPGGAGSDAYSINAQGQVVGRSVTASGTVHAFLWTPDVPNGTQGTMTDLGTLPGRDSSRAYAIASDGRIAGDSYLGGAKRGDDSEHAFLMTPSVGVAKPPLQDLEPLATNDEVIWGLGPNGQAVGQWIQGAKISRGFIWTSEHGFQFLSDPTVYSAAYSMNARSWVAGVLEVKPGVRHAVVWHDGTYTDIGLLPQWDQASATAVNDRGQVIGIGYPVDQEQKTEDGTTDSFLWDGGRLRSLRSFGGLPLMNALGINNKAEIVGEADSGDLDGRAFLWRMGRLADLNSFLPPDSGWQLNGAHAINDAGEIVGYGVHDGGSHAFLMVPVPPTPAPLSK